MSTNKRKVEEIINEKYNDSSTSRDENHVEEKRELVPEEIAVPTILILIGYPLTNACNKINLKHIVKDESFRSFYDVITDIVDSMHVLRYYQYQ